MNVPVNLHPCNSSENIRKRNSIINDLVNKPKVVDGKIANRDIPAILEGIESVLDFARRQSLTYSELDQFLELVKLTAFDYRVR